MAEVLYPYGYAGSKLTMAQLKAKTTWINGHPEFQRRLEALLIAGKGRLGVGTLWRSSATQEKTFLDRHYVVSSGGCCVFNGKRYQKKSGVAHAAPPGKSFHEGTVYGTAAAMDAIGDLNWMHVIEGAYGFKDFRNVGNEPWHIQFLEFPNSVTSWKAAGSPQPKKWVLPGTQPEPEPTPPTPTPTPPASLPAMPQAGAALHMYLVMKYGGTADSNWSGYYSDGNKRYQINSASGGMNHVARLVRAGAKDAKTGTTVTATNWAGVSHTTSTTDLTKYLGPA